MSTLDSQLHLW